MKDYCSLEYLKNRIKQNDNNLKFKYRKKLVFGKIIEIIKVN